MAATFRSASSTRCPRTTSVFFDTLKRDGLITTYTPMATQGVQIPKPGGGRFNVSVQAIDPQVYPLTGQPTLERSSGGDWRAVLSKPGGAVVSAGLFRESLEANLARPFASTRTRANSM